AGLNMCNVIKSGDFFETTTPKPGLHAGIYHQLQSENHLNFSYGLAYTEKGFRYRFDFVPLGAETDNESGEALYAFRYNYAALPLKLGFRFEGDLKINPYIGFTPAYLIRAQQAYTLTDDGGSTDYSQNMYAQASKWDLSCQLGVTADLKSEGKLIPYAGLNLSGSLLPVSNEAYFANENLRHYGVLIVVGIKFNNQETD
ncbi:MAG: outer membrane beta-barrel protein, partial [Bacteroidales bacterium]